MYGQNFKTILKKAKKAIHHENVHLPQIMNLKFNKLTMETLRSLWNMARVDFFNLRRKSRSLQRLFEGQGGGKSMSSFCKILRMFEDWRRWSRQRPEFDPHNPCKKSQLWWWVLLTSPLRRQTQAKNKTPIKTQQPRESRPVFVRIVSDYAATASTSWNSLA